MHILVSALIECVGLVSRASAASRAEGKQTNSQRIWCHFYATRPFTSFPRGIDLTYLSNISRVRGKYIFLAGLNETRIFVTRGKVGGATTVWDLEGFTSD